MSKFSLASSWKRQQTAVTGTGYWNKCYVDDNQMCRGAGAQEPEGQGVTQLQHRPESGQALPDPGGCPVRHVSQGYSACVDWNDSLGDTEKGEGSEMESQKYDGQVVHRAKARGENVKCTQSIGLENDLSGKTDGNGTGTSDAPDGGWGHLILFGCFCNTNFAALAGPCFGILFYKFLLDLETSAATIAFIFNLQNLMWSVAALLAGPVVKRFGCRIVSVTGGILLSLGLIISAFSPSALFLTFSYSFLTGFGYGMTSLGVNAIIPQYFKRLRGRAFAVRNAGVCTGQMVGPLLVTYLQQEYGFTGATLIMGGVLLNVCAAASTFQPVEWHTSKSCLKDDRNTNKNYSLLISTESRYGATVLQLLRTSVTNFMLLRSPRGFIIIIGACFIMSTNLNFFAMIPFMMADTGFTQEEVSWSMSVSGVCNLVTRVVVASMTDWPRFRKRGCYMAGAATIALTIVASSLVRELWGLVVATGAWGCGMGVCLSLIDLIILEYLGVENYVAAYSVSGFLTGVWLLTFGALFGVIRDVSGSYEVSQWVLASCASITFVLWLFMPAAVAYDRRKETQQQQPETQQQQPETQQQQQETQQQQPETQQQQQETQQQQQETQQQQPETQQHQ